MNSYSVPLFSYPSTFQVQLIIKITSRVQKLSSLFITDSFYIFCQLPNDQFPLLRVEEVQINNTLRVFLYGHLHHGIIPYKKIERSSSEWEIESSGLDSQIYV